MEFLDLVGNWIRITNLADGSIINGYAVTEHIQGMITVAPARFEGEEKNTSYLLEQAYIDHEVLIVEIIEQPAELA